MAFGVMTILAYSSPFSTSCPLGILPQRAGRRVRPEGEADKCHSQLQPVLSFSISVWKITLDGFMK